MGIKAAFSRKDVQKAFDIMTETVHRRTIEVLKRVGEECVVHARTLPPDVGFHDRTGNLRSSIGYAIYEDGQLLMSMYDVEKGVNADGQTFSGDQGALKGAALAQEVAQDIQGLTLIVTAGMEYAAALEAGGAWKVKSKRPYDVIASAELKAQRLLPQMLEDMVDQINKA